MRREIQEGLNVVETGMGQRLHLLRQEREIATNQLAEQELSVLSLRLLQICWSMSTPS